MQQHCFRGKGGANTKSQKFLHAIESRAKIIRLYLLYTSFSISGVNTRTFKIRFFMTYPFLPPLTMLRTSYSAKKVVWYRCNNIVLWGKGGANTKSQKFLHAIVGVIQMYWRRSFWNFGKTYLHVRRFYKVKAFLTTKLGDNMVRFPWKASFNFIKYTFQLKYLAWQIDRMHRTKYEMKNWSRVTYLSTISVYFYSVLLCEVSRAWAEKLRTCSTGLVTWLFCVQITRFWLFYF